MEELDKTEYKALMTKLHEMVSSYLNDQVTKPSLETVEKDFHAQDRLATLLLVVRSTIRLVREKGIDIDKHFLSSLPTDEIEKRIEVLGKFFESGETCPLSGDGTYKNAHEYLVTGASQKHLLAYFGREINWIIISVLSASYISALVLMRSAFELLIGVATRKTGKMKERLDSIPFLTSVEVKNLLKLWYYLCGWGHPYGHWVKEVCPGYVSNDPIYHPDLCAICFGTLQKIVDLFVVVALDKYEIPVSEIMAELSKNGISADDLELVSSRVKG
jgi:hypothetical protein